MLRAACVCAPCALQVKTQRFTNDWQRCLELGVTRMVMRWDDAAEEDMDGDGIPDEIVEVGTAIRQCYDLIAMLFSFYAVLSKADSSVSLNEWSKV